jgi:non-ribosomal peptide synthetase component F
MTAISNVEVLSLFYAGVIITMENVTNLVNWWTEFFCVSAVDRILLFSSLSFIMSIRQYLPTLCAGGTVVLPKSSLEFESAILHGKVTKLVSARRFL